MQLHIFKSDTKKAQKMLAFTFCRYKFSNKIQIQLFWCISRKQQQNINLPFKHNYKLNKANLSTPTMNNPFQSNNTNTNTNPSPFANNSSTNSTNPFNQPSNNNAGIFGQNNAQNNTSTPNPQQTGGLFNLNNQAQNQTNSPFGGQQNTSTPNNPASNTLFGNNNQSNQPTTSLFGKPAPDNKPAGIFANTNQNNQNNQNLQNINQQANQQVPNNLNPNSANQQQPQNIKPGNPPNFSSNSSPFGSNSNAQTTNQSAQSNQAPQQGSSGQSGGNALFGGNQTGSNPFTNKPADQSNQQQAAQGSNPPAQTTTTNPLFSNNTASNNTGALGSNTGTNATNQQPVQQSGSQPANQLFGGNKMTTSTTVNSGQQPANILFSNSANTNPTGAQRNPSQNNPSQTNPVNPAQNQNQPNSSGNTGGIFNIPAQNPGQQQSTGQQPNQTGQQPNQTGQQPNQTGQQQAGQQGASIFNSQAQQSGGQNVSQSPVNQPIVNKSPAQIQFESHSKKSIKQYLSHARQEFDQMYNEILKYSNNLIRYQQTREQNQKIYKNFEYVKPQFNNTYQQNSQILSNLEQQQTEIQNSISLIYNAINPDRYDHPLIGCLEECQRLSTEVVQLQMENETEDVQKAMHPSHEQLMLLYASLDKLETDVDSMNEMAEIYFPQPQYAENGQYGAGYRNGMYREFDI